MEKNSMEKKKYSKPCVEFVDFSLTGSIASTCTYKGTNSDANSCGYLDNGWIVYALENICDIFPEEPDFCIHVPTADTSVFSS